jgi:hypothetical protein
VDSAHYVADSIDNEHINWADIDNLGDEGTITVADTTDTTSFVALFESATGDLAAKTDSGITYNAGTGVLTATGFAGPLTGDVTGNVSGTAATVTGAAQAAITSLGTLTTLTVDDITINGNTISSAGASTLAINPTTGQAITFDGTITLDAGIVLGATSITSTAFVGALTGNADSATLASTVTVVDGTDTTSFPLIADSATGSLAVKTDGGLTYNAGTGILTATGFAGPLTGNADTVTTNANLTGEVTSVGNATTIADSVAVSSWTLTTPTITSGVILTGADANPDAV